MVFVLILIAVATIIGSSLLAESSLTAISQNNIASMSKARYLAESGIHHAACLIKENPAAVKASLGSAMGPYSLSDGGQYSFTITELTTPGYFRISSTASSESANSTVSAVLRHTYGKQDTIQSAFLTLNNVGCIMFNTKVYGTAHSNLDIYNFGNIVGNLQAVTSVYNYGTVNNGSISSGRSKQASPITDITAYRTYLYRDKIGFADYHNDNEFSKYEDIRDDRAITDDNPAGVVYVTPQSGWLTLKYDFDFNGTLVVNGNIILEGTAVDLNPRRGFPAIITNGSIFVRNNAEMEIEGVVISDWGFRAYSGESYGSHITHLGSLVSNMMGNDTDLQTNYLVYYDSDEASLYDPTGYGTGGEVTLISWE